MDVQTVAIDESDPEGIAWLEAFWSLAPTEIESFRQRWCEQCRRHAPLLSAERLDACRGHSCGLRDPDAFFVEQVWSNTLARDLARGLAQPSGPQASPAALRELNTTIALFHCLTPALKVDEGGHLVPAYITPVLRAKVHASLLQMAFNVGGIMIDNFFRLGSGEQARNGTRERRRMWEEAIRDSAIIEAEEENSTRSDREIGPMVQVDHKTVGRVLKAYRSRQKQGGAH